MKFITKNQEPQAWRDFRNTEGVAFQAIPELKNALLEEQGFLCCYCMSRINYDTMKVEHYLPRRYENHIFNYLNLFAACEGIACSEKNCDTRKNNSKLKIHPADPKNNCETIIGYKWSDGSLTYPKDYQNDIEEILNLNNTTLKRNRVGALTGAVQVMKTLVTKNGNLPKARVERILATQSGRTEEGKFHPYCQIVVKYLEKKLQNLN